MKPCWVRSIYQNVKAPEIVGDSAKVRRPEVTYPGVAPTTKDSHERLAPRVHVLGGALPYERSIVAHPRKEPPRRNIEW